MMKKTVIAEEISDVQRLISVAVRAANSNSIDGYGRCIDIVRFLKRLNLSTKDIERHSRGIQVLNCLRDHKNPKVRMEVNHLFNSWINVGDCSSSSSTNQFLGLKKRDERSHALGTGETKQVGDCKSFATRPFQTQKQIPKVSSSLKSVRDNTCKSIPTKSRLTQKKPDAVHVFSKLNKTEDERDLNHETDQIEPKLKKPDDCKSIQKKKQSPYCPAKNSTEEMLQLFEIAKLSAELADLKGLLLAKEEASICLEALTLLIGFPISSEAKETRQIMEMLEHLTNHKDHKICNSASALLHHWRQSIIDQEHTRSHVKLTRDSREGH